MSQNANPNPQNEKKGSRSNKLPYFLRQNTGTKLMAALFALLLWIYVLGVTDPVKTKTFRVPVNFENETQLNEADLVVASDPSQVLQDVTVTVSAKVSRIGLVKPNNITAFIDLNNVRSAGTKSLRIEATNAYGEVSVSPSSVEIDFDVRATLTVPIDVQYIGSLPDGYWRSRPKMTPSEIELVGPQREIEKIKSAVCYVSLDGRTQSINEAESVVLLDKNGVEIDDSTFKNTLSSIGLQIDIYPKKTVLLDVDQSIQGINAIRSNFEVTSIKATPSQTEIAGPQDVIDKIDKISISPIDLTDASEPVISTCSFLLPDGVVWSNFDSTMIYVAISEKVSEERFDNFQLDVRDLGRGLTADLLKDEVSILVTGPKSQVEALRRNDIQAYVDVSNRAAGVDTMKVQVDLPAELSGLKAECVPSSVIVTIASR